MIVLLIGRPIPNPSGFVEVDAATLETSIPGIFAGGDLVGDGPSTIVKACGDGRRIAEVITAKEGKSATRENRPLHRLDMVEMLRRRSRSATTFAWVWKLPVWHAI